MPGTPAVDVPEDRPRSIGRSLLLTLPIALWGLLMFSQTLQVPGSAPKLAGLIVFLFMTTLFFLMMRTRRTHRWRRVFFISLGFLFPVGFIWDLVGLRGSMSIPIEQMVGGNTPFCFLAIPMMIVPAALTKTLIFPGSILPTASNPHAVASMVALWLVATLVLGKGWCAYGCFFGGIEEGFAAIAKRPRLRRVDPRWRRVPWAVLAAMVLLSAALYEPVYCSWLCPFKAVTEFPEVTSLVTGVQFVLFASLFLGLVVVLPFLTKLRTQCAFFCPFGPFQALSNHLSVFDVRVDRTACTDCVTCRRACPTMVLDERALASGRAGMHCMKCGACVDACPKGAMRWHIRGTSLSLSDERARLLYLYPAWAFAMLFGGSIIANTLTKLIGTVL